jgi:hypothetical protein
MGRNECECGGAMLRVIVDHDYVEYGLAGITLLRLCTYRCLGCEGIELSIPCILGLHQLIEGVVAQTGSSRMRLVFDCDAWRVAHQA